MELEYINCDICGSNDYKSLFGARDYRFGMTEEYNVVMCNNCGLKYINPRPTNESMLELYDSCYTPDDNPVFANTVETNKTKTVLKRIWHKINGQYHDEIISKACGKILDIGCGNGTLLQQLKQKGNDVYGVELNPKLVEKCIESGLDVCCGMLEDASYENDFFDTIVLSQVIEHIPSPKIFLGEIKRILKSSGNVYIFCPNADSYLNKIFTKYWHGWYVPFHFYMYTEDTIKEIANKAGFKVQKISTITPDNFFTVSLKSFLSDKFKSSRRPMERFTLFDSLFFRAGISTVLRILDFILSGKGDCLNIEISKRACKKFCVNGD